MRKHLSILFVFLLTGLFCFAQQRSVEDAMKIASAKLISGNSINKVAPAESFLELVHAEKYKVGNEEKVLYYILSKPDKHGFVIVSGDERARSILGYSSENSFDNNNIPDGLRYWLSTYATEIKGLQKEIEITDNLGNNSIAIKVPSVNDQFAATVEPLLGAIKWNQSAPYNNLCPVINTTTNERAVTGCVATGMAQVMKYHQWPVSGTGSNTYVSTTNKFNLSVNFSTTTYDWANMANTYTTTSNDIQKNAVATLMYHCGVAVKMDYAESSSASTSDMAKALKNNFGYDANLNTIYRDYYTRTEWVSLLKTELNASRPVLYAGQSSTSGHLFVCDGYDANDFFHFNWGWGGLSDGYYEITALNPSSQGIGGSSGGYNSDQLIVSGLQKPNASSKAVYQMNLQAPLASSVATTTRLGTTTINIKNMFNYGINTLVGNIGLALYNANGFVTVVKNYTLNELAGGYGWSNYDMNTVSIPASVPDGAYKLYVVYKPSTDTNWSIVKGKIATPDYLNVTVTASGINYSVPTTITPVLSLTTFETTGNIYFDKTARFTVQLRNDGQEYNSVLGVYLRSATDETVNQSFYEDVNLINGELKTYYFGGKITLAPGQYYLYVVYDKDNNRSASNLITLGTPKTVEIKTAPTGVPALSLESLISFPKNSAVDKNNAMLTARIVNQSGFFDEKLVAFIFPTTSGSSLTYIGYQNAVFDTNEAKTLTFGGSISLDPGTYRIAVFYMNATDSKWYQLMPYTNSLISFNLVNSVTGVDIPNELNQQVVYPNPAGNFVRFNSEDEVKSISIYNASGQLLFKSFPRTNGMINIETEQLNAGSYLMLIETKTETKLAKFLKK